MTTTAASVRAHEAHPDLPPPRASVGVIGWLRENLFSSPLNSLATLFALYLLYEFVPPLVSWLFLDADWRGETREACSREGACWVFIKVWFKQIMYGRYPSAELWRVNTAGVILAACVVALLLPRMPHKGWIAVFLLLVYPPIAYYLMSGLTFADVRAWPFRLMALSAFALGVVAWLPLVGVGRQRGGAIAWVVLVLTPLWGLSVPSTWTSGMLAGASAPVAVVATVLVALPALLFALAMMFAPTRALIADRAWPLALLVAFLAVVGYALPVAAWDGAAGPAPPWSMVVAPAALALACVAPWGYGRDAGTGGMLARLLLPFYLFFVSMVLTGPPDAFNWGGLDWATNTQPFFAGVRNELPHVETPLWGGLFLTLVIGIVGIVGSLPIGIVLALGRRSHMPIVRALCVAFIELWRGVPLITVLFMASVMFPLFLPEGMNFDKLVRALIGVMLFAAAYMAEVVRGGLQAIPRGQYEAAESLGLSYWKSMNLVILPQALKLVIPGIVNTFIGLFKDTTLVLIIGLFDLLGMVQLAGTNPNWLGFATEGYVFAGFLFWVFCFGMSRYSQRLERKLHTGR